MSPISCDMKYWGQGISFIQASEIFFNSPELKAQVSFSDSLSVCSSICFQEPLDQTSSQEPLGQF